MDLDKNPVECRTLLDTRSNANFITESLVKKLRLPTREQSVTIEALNELNTVTNRLVKAKIASRQNNFIRTLEFFVIPRIAGQLPDCQIDRTRVQIPHNIKLADLHFHKPAPVDMLIESPANSEGFYLPHHAVIKPSSSTTKVRVVFDGSAKSSSGVSLNDALLTGPTIQDDIFGLLLRFRMHPFVLTGDIEKMYRQFLVREEDRPYQRILWRNAQNEISTFQLNTVTFGLSSAPYLATRCLQQLADDESQNYKAASEVIKRDIYVDDLLTGAATYRDAIKLRDQIITLLNKGELNIRQWVSNDPQLLSGLTDDQIHPKFFGDATVKTLGVAWDPRNDTIHYSVNINSPNSPTKRAILSTIAKIFDPLGLLGPVTVTAKIIMQRLWQLKIDWDESLPMNVQNEWQNYRNNLKLLEKVKFNRHITQRSVKSIELHGFCDASERAYGASIYIRTINQSGKIKTQLLCAKSRVAPLKTISLARLELCGANLLATLYCSVRESLTHTISKTTFWTDSTIVLHWLAKSPSTLKTFVANRVAEIQDRVTETRPFTNIGVDYCGPFFIKERKFRNRAKIKVYVAVFICFSTKAIHLEVVSDMTTEAFVAALKRFIARRGICKNIYSDNGTNFVGANNDLTELSRVLREDKRVRRFLEDKEISWHFMPALSPHFGGLWEAAVKSFKHHLKRVVGDELFTYEQFATFVTEIEAILNSRPLTPLSSDPNDPQALTPGHFLIGSAMTSLPEVNFNETSSNRLSKWQHIQKVKHDFWIRWSKEYINHLNVRAKWTKGSHEMNKGTIVILKDDHLPPSHWSLGRIVEVHPGQDDIIRAVTVKTVNGLCKPPLHPGPFGNFRHDKVDYLIMAADTVCLCYGAVAQDVRERLGDSSAFPTARIHKRGGPIHHNPVPCGVCSELQSC
ncbi:uncharacterized protein LOC143364215 [Halictus rubicundus]|uniref:uncharacterized protein LOC143364215 n=1 Tax=Halictus rubicundus TaxID=77578 RepID=UPI004036B1B0